MTDSFIRTCDDSIKLACGGPQIVKRNVIYQLYNGSPFQMGWNGDGCDNCLIENNDVIHAEWQGWSTGFNQQPNDAVIDMDYGGWGGSGTTFNNFSVVDLRVDTSVGRIISLTFNCNTTKGVKINNMMLKDIDIRANLSWSVGKNIPSQLINVKVSVNGNSYLNGLTFDNVTILGKKILSDDDWNLKRYSINSNDLKNVKYQ
eukprot:204645_1